ncbi:MAG: threonine synthase [Promethearchaeota archaeon]
MEEEILFYSTNKQAPEENIRNAILKGQAPDKGLYMPKTIPKLTDKELESLKHMNYSEMAQLITSKFLQKYVPKDILKKLCDDAYNYDVPLEKVEDNKYIMRLDRGPTASFKDFAARLMARLMNYFLEQLGKKLLILTATSGDTGGAVADAFYKQNNVDVIVLYPKNEISERQRKQMTTLGENITAIGIEGKFDDCQRMVKQAFADPDLKNLNLSSANSINFARLLPQTVYYFYAYAKLTTNIKDRVIISVPSGNFGDLMGGVIAYKMGLPVLKFIAAVNENDEFPRFLETSIYQKIEPSRNCLSNAMNVGHPSNLARLIDLYGGHLDEKGNLLKKPNMELLRKDIASVSISDEKTKETIKEVFDKYNIILEPHGAVGWAGLIWYLSSQFDNDIKNKNLSVTTTDYSFNKEDIISISLETADPAKFPEIIREVLNIDPKMPKHLAEAQAKKEEIINLPVNYEQFKKYLLNLKK